MKELEEQDKKKLKSWQKARSKITKIRTEMKEIQTQKNSSKINKSRSSFFEKINKIDRLLARLIKKKRESNQIDATKNNKGISPLIPQKYKLQSEIIPNNLMHNAHKPVNLQEMDEFLDTCTPQA